MTSENQPEQVPVSIIFETKISADRIPELMELIGKLSIGQATAKVNVGEASTHNESTEPTLQDIEQGINSTYLREVEMPDGSRQLLVTRESFKQFERLNWTGSKNLATKVWNTLSRSGKEFLEQSSIIRAHYRYPTNNTYAPDKLGPILDKKRNPDYDNRGYDPIALIDYIETISKHPDLAIVGCGAGTIKFLSEFAKTLQTPPQVDKE